MRSPKALSSRLLGASLIALVSCGIAELALRVAGRGYGSTPLEIDPVLHHRHPRDYRFLAYHPSGEYGGFVVSYDGEGLPADPRGDKPEPACGATRIAIMGDSFAEGGQVEYRKTFAGLIQGELGTTAIVKNYGVAFYSPILSYLQWEHVVSRFKPGYVFHLLSGNDVGEDESYAVDAGFSPAGALAAVPGPPDTGVTALLRRSYLARLARKAYITGGYALRTRGREKRVIGGYVEEDPDIGEATSKYVAMTARAVSRSGARYVLMVVPSKFALRNGIADKREYSGKWETWARERSIPFMDLVEPFRREYRATGRFPFFLEDIHFNEAGHAIVAREVIARGLAGRGLRDGVSRRGPAPASRPGPRLRRAAAPQ